VALNVTAVVQGTVALVGPLHTLSQELAAVLWACGLQDRLHACDVGEQEWQRGEKMFASARSRMPRCNKADQLA
jgi:hypothetical protein